MRAGCGCVCLPSSRATLAGCARSSQPPPGRAAQPACAHAAAPAAQGCAPPCRCPASRCGRPRAVAQLAHHLRGVCVLLVGQRLGDGGVLGKLPPRSPRRDCSHSPSTARCASRPPARGTATRHPDPAARTPRPPACCPARRDGPQRTAGVAHRRHFPPPPREVPDVGRRQGRDAPPGRRARPPASMGGRAGTTSPALPRHAATTPFTRCFASGGSTRYRGPSAVISSMCRRMPGDTPARSACNPARTRSTTPFLSSTTSSFRTRTHPSATACSSGLSGLGGGGGGGCAAFGSGTGSGSAASQQSIHSVGSGTSTGGNLHRGRLDDHAGQQGLLLLLVLRQALRHQVCCRLVRSLAGPLQPCPVAVREGVAKQMTSDGPVQL